MNWSRKVDYSLNGDLMLDISPNNILLSPTDLKSLISQLRAETQTSLRPSELSVGNLFDGDGFVFQDPTCVFRLSSTDNRGQSPLSQGYFSYLCKQSAENHRRPDYMGGQALRSPEELLGAHCGTNTDMWALGCVVGNALFTIGNSLNLLIWCWISISFSNYSLETLYLIPHSKHRNFTLQTKNLILSK